MKMVIGLGLIASLLYSPRSMALSNLIAKVMVERSDCSTRPLPVEDTNDDIEEDSQWGQENQSTSFRTQNIDTTHTLASIINTRDLYQEPYLEKINRPPRG